MSMNPHQSPEAIKARRIACNLTQEKAGSLLYIKGRAWRAYEAGERKMHPAFWELFTIKSMVYFNQEKNRT